MTVDEGGVRKGSLSDLVSRNLADRESQMPYNERLEDAAKYGRRDRWLDLTRPLRTHLQRLAKPLDELLARFEVRELFEEARVLLPQGGIKKIEPQIYQWVVSQPDISKRSSNLAIDAGNRFLLVDEGYGLGLEFRRQKTVKRLVLRSARHESYVWSGPGAGGRIVVTGANKNYWEETGTQTQIDERRTMVVKVIRTAGEYPYDLEYSYVGEFTHPDTREVNTYFFIHPVRIFGSHETLKKLIAEDIVRERTS